ncbi:MAG: thioredoxin family protein [Bdellovibrionaceae bacterium]|nr:thioredoxin family protein [Pseudobdellovibrionaceae bacterium]
MALTYTPPGELSSRCPDFKLLGVDQKWHTLKEYEGSKALVIMFICNHCPYVKAIEDRLIVLTKEISALGAKVIAISSNDEKTYPEDSFENMKKRASEKHYPFPYLYDPMQTAAKAFGAVCTPDFFVYDQDLQLSYRGRLDDSWKDPKQVTRHELRHAVIQLLQNQDVPLVQYPSMGCSIKWLS